MRLLRRIAATNATTVPPLALSVVRTLGKSKTDRRGFLSLFSSPNVFKNSVLLIIARSVYLLTMFSPVLAVSSLSVNPFLTVAAQGGAQFVSYCVANFCASRIGRRWSGVAAPLLAAIASGVIFCMLTVDIAGPALVAMIMVMQFSTTISFSVANLQSVEVHPTCLRQIAACVEWAIAGVAMSALPYLALMKDKRQPFAVLTALNLATALAVSFLPESALQRLPETLQDAALFGKERPYWSWKPKPPPGYTAEQCGSSEPS
ncbi:solute carrier family 22 member 21-like [Schistocerca piceifrons]|uniref:solute carrier family 22 member 21-like n=1 Tax=Schistocerca piceifrons TaxID=274613 RepID=UPI001F5EADAB|nr:solute carrier family 22 member 21-like [Schistocerca piceifrons]